MKIICKRTGNWLFGEIQRRFETHTTHEPAWRNLCKVHKEYRPELPFPNRTKKISDEVGWVDHSFRVMRNFMSCWFVLKFTGVEYTAQLLVHVRHVLEMFFKLILLRRLSLAALARLRILLVASVAVARNFYFNLVEKFLPIKTLRFRSQTIHWKQGRIFS